MIITSKQNSTIKMIKSLHSKKGRKEFGLFIAEGYNITLEALVDGEVELIVIKESFKMQFKEIPDKLLTVVSDEVFEYIKTTVNTQGIMAICKKIAQSMDQEYKFNLYIEDIQDPGNLGTIFRSSEAFGVDCIFMSQDCVDVYNPKTVRATMGSIFRMPFNISQSISYLKKEYNNYVFAGADLHGTDIYDNFVIDNKNIFIVIGNEAHGLKEKTKEICDELVTIPMSGKVESLNASVAVSVVISEIRRKMNKKY